MLMLEKIDSHLLKLVPKSEHYLTALCCDTTDLSARARRVRENLTREKFRELKQENWCLNKAYQAMAQQFEGTKQQIEEQQLKMKKLEEENRRLKEDAEKSPREGGRNTEVLL